MSPEEWLRLTLDPGRLAVVGLLAAGPRTVDELTALTGQRPREVLGTVGVLVQAGLAEESAAGADTTGSYRFVPAALRRIATSLPAAPEADQRVLYGMTDDEQAVLTRFFRGARLTEIPAGRAKRRVVLERLALEFEPGVYYPEPEVNDVLSGFHDDYAALRRYLVDEGLLSREQGRYWRSGGRVG